MVLNARYHDSAERGLKLEPDWRGVFSYLLLLSRSKVRWVTSLPSAGFKTEQIRFQNYLFCALASFKPNVKPSSEELPGAAHTRTNEMMRDLQPQGTPSYLYTRWVHKLLCFTLYDPGCYTVHLHNLIEKCMKQKTTRKLQCKQEKYYTVCFC